MGEKHKYGKIFINGVEYEGEGLTDFELSEEAKENAVQYIYDNLYIKNPLTFTCTISTITYLKLLGIWSWVLENCTDARIRHLMNYGRTKRVKLKNYQRALHEISKRVTLVV